MRISPSASLLLSGLLLAGPAQAQTASVPDFSGVWLATSPRSTISSALPALTPRAQADLDAFDPLDDPVIRCVPPGFPRSGTAIYPMEIVQTDDMILFLYETFGMIRRIYLDGRARPEYLPPGLMGYSEGQFDGQELVIHTFNYAPGLLTGWGIRQYGDMTVEERYRLLDDGRGLEGTVAITAPETFAEPWRRTFTWQLDPDGMIFESICDPNDSRF